MARAKAASSKKIDARLALILAAERHFALHGFEGTPLSVIHNAAGQKNASATHYHFGSRNGLIEAILEYRMAPLNERRAERMVELDGLSGTHDLRSLMVAWIMPLAEELQYRPEGNHYLRFLDRLRRGPSKPFAERIMSLQSEYRHLLDLIDQQLSHVPPRIRQSRLGIAAEQIVSALAALEADLPTSGPDHPYPALAINSLIDYITGGLGAGCHPETEALALHPSQIDFHFRISNETHEDSGSQNAAATGMDRS
ncbi:TetR/AcrR family transcriptional regulator [Rhizorhabdus wittichii]|uniref:TetR/AcrR family transcriptional regulator n=1 Tax=Rhizorhabdus wittichii TaxID=160791 RepID=UPI0002E51DA0|nr:TetR/AcrR family transcriptional regulator [Rhizorhabdus wittichii]